MDVSGLAKVRLEWLAENEPEYLRELLQTNQMDKLDKDLDQALLRAAFLIRKARQGGMTEIESRCTHWRAWWRWGQRRTWKIRRPNPLPASEREEIYCRVLAREKAQERARTRRQKSREN